MSNKNKKKELMKTIPNYAKNVTRSVMFSTKDIFKEITPEVAQFVESSSKITREALSESRKFNVNFQTYLKNFNNSQVMKDIKQGGQNLKDDLKSGNFYNTKRAEDTADAQLALDDSNMLKELGFDMDDNGGLDDEAILAKMAGEVSKASGMDSGTTKNVVNNISMNNISTGGNTAGAMLAGIAQSSRLNAKASIGGSQLIVDTQNTLHGVRSLETSRMFTEVSFRLQEMTGYMKGLYDFTEVTGNFYKATTEFYDKSVEDSATIAALQKELLETNKKYYGYEDVEETTSSKTTHSDVFRGGFDPAAYLKSVKGKMKEKADSTGIASMLDFMGDMSEVSGGSVLSTLLQSPGKFISDGIANKLIVDPLKESSKELNNTFKSFFKGASLKGTRMMKEKDSELWSIFSDIIGVKADDRIELGDSSKFKAKGFDTNANLALTEVIPTYLRKILKQMSGGKDEYVYDYEARKFKTIKSLEEDRDRGMDSATKSGSFDIRSKVNSNVDKLKMGVKDKTFFKEKTADFIKFLTDEELFFDPENDTYDTIKGKGLTGFSKKEFDIVKNLIASTGKNEYIKLNDAVYDTREMENSFAERFNTNLFQSGNSALYNGFSNEVVGGAKGPLSSTLSLSTNDYLSDIKNILLEGIFVYGLNPAEGFTRTVTPDDNPSARLNRHRGQIAKAMNTSSSADSKTYTPSEQIIDALVGTSPEAIASLNVEEPREGEVVETTSGEAKRTGVIGQIIKLPARLANAGIKSIDKGMKSILYGKEAGGMNFMEATGIKIKETFTQVNDYLKEKILSPLEERFFGENGIMTKFEEWLKPKVDVARAWVKKTLFGDGETRGVLSNAVDFGKDMLNKGKNYITGKGYTDRNGNVIEERSNSVLAGAKEFFNKSKDKLNISLFGNIDEADGKRKGGFLTGIKDKVTGVFTQFKDKYIGDIDKDAISDNMPKILSGAGIGAGAGLFSSLFLPFGIGVIPGMLLGGATAFVKSNEKAQNYLFGEDGVLGPKVKDALDKYGGNTMKGAGIGAGIGVLTGNPLLGVLLGSSIGFATKSDKFKEFMFGKDGDDSNALIKQETMKKIKSALPGAAAIGAGTFLYSNLGFLGSSLLPGGIVGASLFGFASSMALQSDSVKKFLFGEKDEEGNITKDGVMGKVGTWFKYSFVEQIKLNMWSLTNRMGMWFKDKVGNNLLKAFRPMFEQVKLTGKNIANHIGSAINGVFEKSVGLPLKEFTEKTIFGPMKKLLGGLFNGFKKVIEIPFKTIGNIGEGLAEKHQKMGLDYASGHLKGIKERDAKAKADKAKFDKDENDRQGKLSFLQSVMKKYGYDRSNEHVKSAKDDFDTKYKGGKWKEYELESYKTFNSIDKESIKQSSLLDNISNILGVVKEDFSGLMDHLKTYLPDDLTKPSNSKSKKAKSKDSKEPQDVPVPDLENVIVNEDGTVSLGNPFGLNISNPFKGATTFAKAKMRNVKDAMANFKSNVKEGAVNTKAETGRESKEKKEKASKDKSDDSEEGPVNLNDKNKKTKETPLKEDNAKKSRTYLEAIKRSNSAIEREVSGQLDGVGWNLDAIRRILSKHTGLDEKGIPLRRGNKKGSIFNRIKNAIMKPFDFIKDKITNVVTGIGTAVTSVFSGLKNVVGGGVKFLKGTFKVMGTVLIEGAKAAGTILTEGTKVIGKLLTSTVKVVGNAANGIVVGLGKAVSGMAKGLGTLVGGLTSALGNLISGLGSVTKSLLQAGGTLIKGMAKLTTDVVKGAYAGIKGLVKGVFSLISKPAQAVGRMLGKKEKGKAVRVMNFGDMLGSLSSPMNVIIVGDKTKDANGNYIGDAYNVEPKSSVPEVSTSTTGDIVDLGSNNTGVTSNIEKLNESVADSSNSVRETGNKTLDTVKDLGTNMLNTIKELGIKSLAILKGKGKDGESSTETEDTKEPTQDVVDLGTSNKKNKKSPGRPTPKQRKTNKSNASRQATKILSDAQSEVNAYSEKISNIKDYNYVQDAKNVDEVEAEKIATSTALAQNTAASKGMFSIMAKGTKKGGLFSTLGTFLMIGFPALFKKITGFFAPKNLFKLAGKVFGRNGFLLKGMKSVFGTLFGKNSLIMKGIGAIGTGMMSLVKMIGSSKLFQDVKGIAVKGLDAAKGLVSKGGEKIKGMMGIEKIELKNKKGKKGKAGDAVVKLGENGKPLKGKNGKINISSASAKGLNVKSGTKTKIKKSGKAGDAIVSSAGKTSGKKVGKITSAGKSGVKSAGKPVKKKGKLGKLTGALNIAGDVAGGLGIGTPSAANFDLSNINDAVVINGNAVIQVNGSVVGGGFDGTGSGTSGITDVVDIATDLMPGKKGKGAKAGKKAGKKAGSKATSKAGKLMNKAKGAGSKFLGTKGGKIAAAVGGSAVAGGALAFGSSLLGGEANEDGAEDFIRHTGKDLSKKLPSVLSKGGANAAEAVATSGANVVADAAASPQLLSGISDKVMSICKSDFFTKGFGKNLDAIPKVAEWIMKKFSKFGTTQLGNLLAKLTKKATTLVGGGAISFGLIPAAFLGWDAVTGAVEARKIFKLGKDAKVTSGMRVTTGLAKLVDNNLTFGFIDITEIANFIYGIIGKDENKDMLKGNQAKFEEDYAKYVADAEAKGEEVKSFDKWNSEQNKGVFKSAVDGVKSAGSAVWNGTKKAGSAVWNGAKKIGSSVGGAVSGAAAFLTGGLIGKKKGDKKNPDGTDKVVDEGLAQSKNPIQSTKGPIDADNLQDVMKNDANILYTDYSTKYRSLSTQIGEVDSLRKRSDILLNKSASATDLTLKKANEAIMNSTSLYGDVAASAMSSTMGMATMNTSVGGNVPQDMGGGTGSNTKTSLWDSVKSVGRSIGNGVKKFFSWGDGDGDATRSMPTPARSGDTGSSAPQSTASAKASGAGTKKVPGAEYINGMVYFNQREQPWGNIPYTITGDSKQTIGASGCGPTSAAMVVSSLTGKFISPAEASKWSLDNGFRTPNEGTSWDFFKPFGNMHGVGFTAKGGSDKSALQAALKARKPVIMSGTGGHPYTKGGHFVAAAGISPDGNQVIVNDPNYRDRTKAYPISQLLSQTRQMWIPDKSLDSNIDFSAQGDTTGVLPDGASSVPGATPEKEINSPMDILTSIGEIIGGATSSILMGKVYEGPIESNPAAGLPGGANPSGGGFAGATSLGYNGPTGTHKLAETYSDPKIAGLFDSNAAKYNVDPGIMKALSMQESSGNIKAGYTKRPAWGLMQIENTLDTEFAEYGKANAGTPFSPHDKIIPEKAIPFGAKKLADNLKHYNGDYAKTLQGYNYGSGSLDMLIKKYPDNWMQNRDKMHIVNGYDKKGWKSYGDSQYIENVMKYYYPPSGGTKSSLGEANSGGDYGRQPSQPTSTSVTTVRKPKSVDINRALATNMQSMTDKMNNVITAKKISDESIGQGQHSDLSAIIAHLETIANNTSDISVTNREIASKDMCVNNVYGTPEGGQSGQNGSNSSDVKRSSGNMFTSPNGDVSGVMSRGYQQAKALTRM